MYSREEVKALSDKVLTMAREAQAEAADVSFEGGERAGTRWANSTITTNLVQYRPANFDQRPHRNETGERVHTGVR